MGTSITELGGVQNSWAEDYLPRALVTAGNAARSALGTGKTSVSEFFVAHPTAKNVLTGVAITAVVVGGSLLINFGPQLIHTPFIQSIIHSGLAKFGENVFLWGKDVYHQMMYIIPVVGGGVALMGGLVILSTGNLSHLTSTDSAILAIGGYVALFGVVSFFH